MSDALNGWLQVDSTTVGQYTGLKDKNDVEIYEGDVVQRWTKVKNRWEQVQTCVVKWILCVSAFKSVDQDELLHSFDNGYLYKIICNIHDNPELLGGADNA